MRPQIILLELMIIVVFLSCQKSIEGSWKFDYTYANRPLIPAYLIIDGDTSRIIDRFGIVHDFSNTHVQRGRLILANDDQRIEYTIDSIQENLLQLDSIRYTPVDSLAKESPITVELIGPIDSVSLDRIDSHGAYSISIKEEQQKLILKMGDLHARIDDMPLYLQCSHCSSNRSVTLIVDRHLSYARFKEVLFWLRISGVTRFSVVAESDKFGVYTGLNDKIEFWDEDMLQFSEDYDVPPLPPLVSREEYLSQSGSMSLLKVKHQEDLQNILSRLNEGHPNLLINMDDLDAVADYIVIKLKVKEALQQIRDTIAQEKYGTAYQALKPAMKRLLSQQGPQVNFEIRAVN
ncbi:MAG: hypothetical protein AAFP77_22295 [Bacteroidota bacterium]